MNNLTKYNQHNPKNFQSKLYKRLTRLFSGPITNYHKQFVVKNKKKDITKYNFKTASSLKFDRGKYNPFSDMHFRRMDEMTRFERYIDFEQMDYEPIMGSALDTYADEITAYTVLDPILKITAKNDQVKQILHELYYNIMNIESNAFSWARMMCKYGDYFLYLDIDEDKGVTNFINIPAQEMEKLEGLDESNPSYVQYQWTTGGLTFENWQVAHFKIEGDSKYSPYGMSIFDPVRRTWRMLVLMEEFMMSYRMTRAAERRVWYLEMGGIDPSDEEQLVQKVITQIKRTQVADPDTGNMDRRYNPQAVEEDIFLTKRGDVGSRVEQLPGGQFTNAIDDIKYLQEKLFTGLKIPQEYLSRGERGTTDKETLTLKDVKFSKVIQRLQKHFVNELVKIGRIHLYVLGIRGNDLLDFNIQLNNPSKVAEMQQLEVSRTKLDFASVANESPFYSTHWCSTKVLGMTEKEFERNQIEKFADKKRQIQLDSIEKSAESGLGGEFGEDLGSMPQIPQDSLDTLESVPEEGLEGLEPEMATDNPELLAAPGKRDYDPDWRERETPGSKGKTYTKRGQTPRPKRTLKAQGALYEEIEDIQKSLGEIDND